MDCFLNLQKGPKNKQKLEMLNTGISCEGCFKINIQILRFNVNKCLFKNVHIKIIVNCFHVCVLQYDELIPRKIVQKLHKKIKLGNKDSNLIVCLHIVVQFRHRTSNASQDTT